jgi:hypothetical protein
VSDPGKQASYQVGGSVSFGTSGPFTLTLDAGTGGVYYRDTRDPSLFNQQTTRASIGTELRFSQVTVGTASVSATRFEAEDTPRTRRDTVALSFGVTHQFNDRMSLSVRLGGRQIDDSTSGTTRSGEGNLTLTHAGPTGDLSLSLDTALTIAGRRDLLEVSRSFEFPTWVLTATLGGVDAPGADPQLNASLSYARELPWGDLSATLSRDVTISDFADVQQVLQTNVDYTHILNAQSSVSFGVEYADIRDLGGTGTTESQRGAIRATYQRQLAQDWSLSAGYEHRFLSQTGSSTARDNAVFVTLDRSFTFLQ